MEEIFQDSKMSDLEIEILSTIWFSRKFNPSHYFK